MIKGNTSSGFAFEIEDHVIDNMELLDAIVELDENPAALSKVTKMLLTADQQKKLYDHLRTEKGNVPILAVTNEVAEIFNYNQQTKN